MTFFVMCPDHPGFHYSPDGEKKDSCLTKDGPTPRRGRRRGKEDIYNQRHIFESCIFVIKCLIFVLPEPLSKLLKNAKQNAANTDVEKVSGTQRRGLILPWQGTNINP